MNDATQPPVCKKRPDTRTSSKPHPPQSHECFKATVEEEWSVLRGEVTCSVPEIDLDLFLKYLLPPLRDGIDVDSIISSMKDDGLVTQDGKWEAFKTIPSRRKKESEWSVFVPLEEIWHIASSAASKHLGMEPVFALSLRRSVKPKSRQMTQAAPDGYVIIRDVEECAQHATGKKGKIRWWHDIALTAEFRKRASVKDRSENISKMMFNVQRTMTLDPSRRFTFGITIEDTSMRLWFCSRATPVVSEAFNFTKDMRLLTQVFLSLAFASKEELGWDPTIRPILKPNGERVYEIDLGDKTYETEEVLSESSAEALVSHATRVWTVKHVESGVSYVLKDVWVEDDKPLEHEIRDSILHNIEEKFGADGRRDAEEHLLTPVAHCVVSIDGREDHTTDVMMRGFTPSMRRRFKIRVKRASDSDGGSESSWANSTDVQMIQRELRAPFPRCLHRRKVFRRKHYRIVFKEIANDLHTVVKLSDAFTVLRDGAKVLQLIHESGWVHRDISPANMYLYEGRGLVGDLEYAKQRQSDLANERCTGTVDFMATEIAARSYKHLRDDRDPEKAKEAFSRLLKRKGRRITKLEEIIDIPPFFHNDLHDLESLWWIAIWELFFNRDYSRVEQGELAAEQDGMRCLASRDLFSIAGEAGHRASFLRSKATYERWTEWVPDGLYDIQGFLDDLRVFLVLKYIEFESGLPAVRLGVFEGAHDFFSSGFEDCRRSACEMEASSPGSTHPSCLAHREGSDNLSVPSLGRGSEGRTSRSSSSNFDAEIQESASSVNVVTHAIENPPKEWAPALDDFPLPMPSLCISRYELEVY